MTALVYGSPAPGLVDIPAAATQTSPLVPASSDLAALPDASADTIHVLAPPGTLERAYVLAHALRVLAPGGVLTVFAPKDKGGTRLKKVLQGFGCEVAEDARRHHRFCFVKRPAKPEGLDAAIAAGAPRLSRELGLWTQPGVFSWDRLDPGSAQLLSGAAALAGRGADLGCGIGVLATQILASEAVSELACVDIDRRAIDCATRNLSDPRVTLAWADVRAWSAAPADLDFVLMNPPFHDGGAEDRHLGQAFIQAAAAMLRQGGTCRLVANRHLPYEATLAEAFAEFALVSEGGGYKVYEAVK